MKKVLALLLTAVMLASVFAAAVSAEGTSAETPAETCVESQKKPDWLITEIANDMVGDGTRIATYTDPVNAKDGLEAIEIYNNSDTVLNLYEYCLTYNGNNSTNAEKFEREIKEITPFLTNGIYEDKVGNYLDGSTFPAQKYQYEQKNMGTLDLVMNDSMKNPQTCLVEPGECVVLWIMYYEAYLNCFNDDPSTPAIDGTGFTKDDFRKFWSIPEDVKVICVDGNSSTTYGGNDHNFNVKNSDCGTYGIAKYSDELVANCNTAQADGSQAAGLLTDGYWTYEGMVAWASNDFTTSRPGLNGANLSVNFVPDFTGAVAEELGRVWSGGRMAVVDANCQPSLGSLTDLQKLMINPAAIPAGTVINLSGYTYYPYIPNKVVDGEIHKFVFYGYLINGERYAENGTYTVPAAGITSVDFIYDEVVITTEPEEEETQKPADTTPKPADTTAKPADTTPKPADTTAKPAAEPEKKSGGCGGFTVAAQIVASFAAIFGLAVIIGKKNK